MCGGITGSSVGGFAPRKSRKDECSRSIEASRQRDLTGFVPGPPQAGARWSHGRQLTGVVICV